MKTANEIVPTHIFHRGVVLAEETEYRGFPAGNWLQVRCDITPRKVKLEKLLHKKTTLMDGFNF